MLGDKDAIATVAVKNVKAAAKFYIETLGLRPMGDEPGVLTVKAGQGTLFVYESEYARTNKATAVSWEVGDELEQIVQTLKSRGVMFEHYENLPNTKREGDVHIAGGDLKLAWFKDPDGNIHGLFGR